MPWKVGGIHFIRAAAAEFQASMIAASVGTDTKQFDNAVKKALITNFIVPIPPSRFRVFYWTAFEMFAIAAATLEFIIERYRQRPINLSNLNEPLETLRSFRAHYHDRISERIGSSEVTAMRDARPEFSYEFLEQQKAWEASAGGLGTAHYCSPSGT